MGEPLHPEVLRARGGAHIAAAGCGASYSPSSRTIGVHGKLERAGDRLERRF